DRPGGEGMPTPLFGCSRGAVAGVLPQGPRLAPVHRGVHTARERECPRRPEVARVLPPPVLRAVYRLAVAHVGTPAAAMISTASSTSALLPTMNGVFWCNSLGTRSRIGRCPSVASSPACSTTSASGAASYNSSSLPSAERLSPGYRKMPPEIRLRWKSATSDPM